MQSPAYPSHALLVRVAFNDGPLRWLLFQLVGLSILRVTTVYFITIVRYEIISQSMNIASDA